MVYFTTTASNVLFGWWGHEMMSNGDEELFTRVIQFGAMSPICTAGKSGGCLHDAQGTRWRRALQTRTGATTAPTIIFGRWT
jgi:alpha-glucosidase (family GH31 glycosyl hydrolase)